jgi:RNA polymerase sigma-70 factor (ECF subfamily)
MPEKMASKCFDPLVGLAPSTALSDEAIATRVMDGDLAAFELIIRRYNQRLFRVARGILGSDEEAEDVVQEAYIRAYEHLGEFEGRASFSTWLTKIVVYAATKRRRKMRRVRPFTSEDELMSVAETADDPRANASRNEIRSLLAGAVDELPPGLRVIFILRLVEGLDTEETARTLDLTPANVKVRLHRARALLRQSIDQRLEGETRALYRFDGKRCDRIVRAVITRLGRA